MSELERYQDSGPLNSLKQIDERGEYWSTRDLMDPVGYARWEPFAEAVEKARAAVRLDGGDPDVDLRPSTKIVKNIRGERRKLLDYRLTRRGAYALMQACDSRKPKVASAWTYFREQTLKAEEIDDRMLFIRPADYPAALRAAANAWEEEQRAKHELEIAESAIKVMLPAAAEHETYMATQGTARVEAVAKAFGSGLQYFYDFLREHKVVYSAGAQRGKGYSIQQDWIDSECAKQEWDKVKIGREAQYVAVPAFTPKGISRLYRLIAKHGWGMFQASGRLYGKPRKGRPLVSEREILDMLDFREDGGAQIVRLRA